MSEGLLIIISGPSGAGKGTVCKELISMKLPELELSVSATTRKPRMGEIEGISYFFKTKEEFVQMISQNDFIEYAQVYDNYYGTPRSYVQNKLDSGKDVILEIDIQGAMQVKKNNPEGIFVFIMPPSFEELKHRIITRGTETKEDILKRLHEAYREVCSSRNYDYIITNDDVRIAAEKVRSIIIAEKCKLQRTKIDYDSYKEE
ncbi:MAG: guanylate kinase [Clostridiales bacterium GWB2_37_7]|nr:MAG: guanylate kinase [Clostridiales bacterium GWB2_37_7]